MSPFAFGDNPALARNIKIYLIKRYTGKKLKEIGDEFGIGDAGVSQTCQRLSTRIDGDIKLVGKLQKIRKNLACQE